MDTNQTDRDDDVFGDIAWACRFWGGADEPVNPATIYRWIKLGRIPGLVKVGPGTSRAVKAEHRAARQAMIEQRASTSEAT